MTRLPVNLAILVLAGVAVFSLSGFFFMDADPYRQDLQNTIASPSLNHWLGTDYLGRSVYGRLAIGAGYSLAIASSTVAIAGLCGLLLGITAGYFGRTIDTIIMRLVDLTLAFPGLLFAIVLVGLFGGGMVILIAALSAGLWCDYCRLARNITRSVRTSDHLQAGLLLGFPTFYLVRAYIVPAVLPQLATLASLSMGRTILNIAGLGFLGIGLKPPLPEWGGMINEGLSYMSQAPLLVIAPGVLIFLTVFGFQLLAGSLSVKR